MDITSPTYQELDDEQENTDEAKWLKANCANYGYILRYPTDKSDVTGIVYEPWHFRYVGKTAAKEIMKQGITLEEYLEQQKRRKIIWKFKMKFMNSHKSIKKLNI